MQKAKIIKFDRYGLVTGLHRSGTTWLGRALALAPGCSVLHEPLNFAYGVKGVPRWYPNGSTVAERDQLARIFRSIIDGSARYKTERRPTDSFLKGAARRLTGGPDNWRYRKIMNRGGASLVLKDPFCLRISLWLAKEFDFRVAILVRHPAALLGSFRRMSWSLPNILGEADAARFPKADSKDSLEFAAEVGYFWRVLYREALEQVDCSRGKIIMVRHEDLCRNPMEHAELLFEHLGVLLGEQSIDFLRRSTSGNLVSPQPGVLHSMSRNAVAVADSWRSRISERELSEIERAAGDVLQKLYR